MTTTVFEPRTEAAPHKVEHKLTFHTGQVQGYGGPGYSWLKVVFANKLLDETKGDDFWLGKSTVRFEDKWKSKTIAELCAEAEHKLDASSFCFNCGNAVGVDSGGSSCVDKTFCTPCRVYIPAYIEQYQSQQRRKHAEYRTEAKAQAGIAAVNRVNAAIAVRKAITMESAYRSAIAEADAEIDRAEKRRDAIKDSDPLNSKLY